MKTLTDDDIAVALERIADHAAAPSDANQRVARRLQVRRRRRRATTGLIGLAAIGGLAVGVSGLAPPREDQQIAVAADGTDTDRSTDPALEPVVQPAPGELPRLTIDMPGLDLVRAAIGTTEFSEGLLQSPPSTWWFQSFRPASDDWSGPGVYVQTGSRDGLSLGETAPGWTPVDVNGHSAVLHTRPDGRASLGWHLPDGTTALVTAHDVSTDELVALARSMQLRPDAQGWAIGDLPSGLVPVLDEAVSHRPRGDSHGLTFAGDVGRVDLHSSTDTATSAEGRIAGELDGPVAAVSNTTVRGIAAAVVRRADDETRVFWFDRDLGIEHYLIIDSALSDQVEAIIASITELDEATWNDLLDGADTTYWTGDTPSSSRP